ncbi:MAG: OmpA family protein [Alphaproteobacteria bacterium]|nr:OmpA family protein [Alphaproteobacteria bacterium]
MSRMLGAVIVILVLMGGALAVWSPVGAPKGDATKTELARVAAARDAAEKALADAEAKVASLRQEADKAAAAAREEGERKLAAARTEAEKAMAALRRETEGLIAAIRADADKAVAAAKAQADKAAAGGGDKLAALRDEAQKTAAALRSQLEQCQAAASKKPEGESARCATGSSAPSTGPVAAADIARELDSSGSIALYGIQFDTGSAKLTAESRASIDEIAKLMKDDTKLKLLVVGHTDNRGDFNLNRTISEQRAQAVVTDLVGRLGIEPARLSSAGVADLAPVSTNDTETGRARNRRVEFVKR